MKCYNCSYKRKCSFYRNYSYHLMKNCNKKILSIDNPLEIDTKEIKDDNKYIIVDIKYPVINGLNDENIQKKMNSNFENDVVEFKNQLETSAKEYYEQNKDEDKEILPYVISTVYSVTYNKNNIISISMLYYELIQGVNSYIKTSYNYDLSSGNPIPLEDLFKEGVNYKEILNEEIRKELVNNKEKYFPGASEKFKGIASDQPYYIENDALAIYFGFNQIAPIEAKIPIIKIPFNNLKNYLKPMFINRTSY